MYSDFNAYAVGPIYASVCTSLSDEEATAQLNLRYPTGIPSLWSISSEKMFADGTPHPCPCQQFPETHRHLLFNC